MEALETQTVPTPTVSTSGEAVSASKTREALPQSSSAVTAAHRDLWQAIRSIIALQSQAPALAARARDREAPLSYTQERLWFLEQLLTGNTAYNIPFALRLQGSLNITALEQSLSEIVRRHEALRTTFSSLEGQPVQVVIPAFRLTLEIEDFTLLPDAEQETAVTDRITQEAQTPFDLAQETGIRARLLRLAAQDHVLLLTVHHIVFDGWSEGVLWRELTTLYQAFSAGQASPLPDLTIQYRDYASWQRQWLQGEFLEALQSYWKQQLGGQLDPLRLPTDRDRPTHPTRQSQCQRFQLSGELSQSLKHFGRREGATLFATLLAAFNVVLHRYTAQDDLYVCSPIANRNRKELQGLIGYFVNLLVLRADLSGEPSFRDLLARVKQSVSGAYAHQDLPVQQLMSRVEGIQASLSQVMFVLQNTPRQATEWPGLTVSFLEVDNGTADFDLSLSIEETAGELRGVLKYNRDRFEASTIAQMIQHYQTVLTACIENPDQPIATLLPLSDAEQQQLAEKRDRNSAVTRTEQSYIAPRDNLELQLVRIWENVLGVQPISVTDNFFEVGGESLRAMTVFTHIEDLLGQKLPLVTLLQAPTVEQLARLLKQKGWTPSWSPLVPIQPRGAKPPLFCVHGVHGNVLTFMDLAKHLGPEQPVYGLQARGLDGQQDPIATIEEMASLYLQEIRTVQPAGPYFLSGYSFGGKVALEMAQQLHAQGEQVALLALFDTYGPGAIRRRSHKELSFQERLLLHRDKLVKLGPSYLVEAFKDSVAQKIRLQRRLQTLTRKLGFTPVQTSSSSVSRTLSLEEVHRKAFRDYKLRVYPDRITLFLANERWFHNTPNYFAQEWYQDPQFGWGKAAGGGLEIYQVPGNHDNLLKEPHVSVLAETLRTCLARTSC